LLQKNPNFLHDARLEYSEQRSKLCRLQIPNINNVKKPGTDSIFESSMNFEGVQTFWGKYDKFSKILYSLDIRKSEFIWVHLYARKSSSTQVPKGLGFNKRKEFEVEIQTLQYLSYKLNLQGFHSSFRNT
jgi:hypothetical protein